MNKQRQIRRMFRPYDIKIPSQFFLDIMFWTLYPALTATIEGTAYTKHMFTQNWLQLTMQ